MSGPKRVRISNPPPPPSVRAAVAAVTPRVTADDLGALACGAGLKFSRGADLDALAVEATEALQHYALFYRADHANAGPGEVERWARSLERWAADGLSMLGGTLDDNAKASGWSLHSMATMQLGDAWPAFGTSSHLEYLLHMAAGHPRFPDELGDRPTLNDLIRRCAAGAELIQMLAGLLIQRTGSRQRETRPVEYARRHLLAALSGTYERLHSRKPNFSRSPGNANGRNARDNLPNGPVLDWLRGLLELVAARSNDPVIAQLACWAQRPDTIAGLLRKISRETPKIIP